MGRIAVPTTDATTARQTESRLRELDRKSSGAASVVESVLASGRHHWHGSGLVDAGGFAINLSTWTPDVDDGIASMSVGQLTLRQEGRWSLWFQYVSDASEPGNSACWLEGASAAVAPWGPFQAQLRDERLRGSGYSQAGNLAQSVTWSGVVTADQVASPIRPRVRWLANGTGVQATATWQLTAHYLGAARTPS
jgi:hypothetical protein